MAGFEIKKAEFVSYFQSVLIRVYLWFNCFMLVHSASQLLTLKGGPQRGTRPRHAWHHSKRRSVDPR